MKLSDEQLIDLIRQDDEAAFRQLFDRHYRLLLGTAINMLKDLPAAKDEVQEMFIKLWNTRHQIEIRSSVPNYLKRSVINRCLNKLKSRKSFEDEEVLEMEAATQLSAQDNLETSDLKAVLDNALNQLPERCRTIFILCRLEGLSHKEIGERLDISPKTVENQMTKALRVLKAAVKPFMKKKSDYG